MNPSEALRTIREKLANASLIKPAARRPRARGYKKQRGKGKQALYDRIVCYALANPLSTLGEISLANQISFNAVASALREAGVRKNRKHPGGRRVPWVKYSDTQLVYVQGADPAPVVEDHTRHR
jgi:hypothetical protein